MNRNELKAIIKEVIEESRKAQISPIKRKGKIVEEMSKASDIEEYLLSNPEATAKEVADSLGIDTNSVRVKMTDMRKAGMLEGGRVERIERKRYEDKDVTFRDKKGGKVKSREELEAAGKGRVEAALPADPKTNKNLIKLLKLKSHSKKIAEKMKKLENAARDQFIRYADDLMPLGTEMYTKVFYDALLTVTVNKKTQRETFDKKIFLQKCQESLGKEFELILKLFNESMSVSDVASKVEIEGIEEEGVVDSVKIGLSKIKDSLKNTFKKLAGAIKKTFGYDPTEDAIEIIGEDLVYDCQDKAEELGNAVSEGSMSFDEAWSKVMKGL